MQCVHIRADFPIDKCKQAHACNRSRDVVVIFKHLPHQPKHLSSISFPTARLVETSGSAEYCIQSKVQENNASAFGMAGGAARLFVSTKRSTTGWQLHAYRQTKNAYGKTRRGKVADNNPRSLSPTSFALSPIVWPLLPPSPACSFARMLVFPLARSPRLRHDLE